MKSIFYKGEYIKTVDDSTGSELAATLVGNRRPPQIEIDGEVYRSYLLEVRNGDFGIEGQKQIKQEAFREQMQDWSKYWHRLVKQSPEYKADTHLSMFDLWWFSYTAIKCAPTEKWKEARERTIEFFRENKNRTVCDFRIWRDLFPEVHTDNSKKVEGMVHIGELLRGQIPTLLLRQLGEDLEMSKTYV